MQHDKLKISNSPKRIIFEVTNRCNLRCQMCAQSSYDFNYSTLPWETFEQCIPYFKHAEEVTLFGWGEPLLHPRFKEMCEATAEFKNLKTYIVSNGLLLDRFAETFVKNKMSYLSISFDGGTKETYEDIRQGSSFEKVISNIKELQKIKIKHKTKFPYLRLIMVVSRKNIMELPLLIDLAEKMGIKEVKVIYVTVYQPKDVMTSLWFYRDMTREIFDMSRKIALEKKVLLRLPPLIGEDDSEDSCHRKCSVPNEEVFIGSDNNVRPCIISNETLGSMNAGSIGSIWQNNRFREFRAEVNSNDLPDDCKSCNQNRHINVNLYESHIKINAQVPQTKTKEILKAG